MASRRRAPGEEAVAERPAVPLEGIELARARAWHKERPSGGPPRLSAAQLAAQLKAQAAEHGLADFVCALVYTAPSLPVPVAPPSCACQNRYTHVHRIAT